MGRIKKRFAVKVNEVCMVSLSIGKHYKGEIECDVMDMDACHMLLGRPWQYDKNTEHKGRDNTFSFNWNGNKMC